MLAAGEYGDDGLASRRPVLNDRLKLRCRYVMRRGDCVDLGNPGATEKRIGYADAVAYDHAHGNGHGFAFASPGEGPVRE